MNPSQLTYEQARDQWIDDNFKPFSNINDFKLNLSKFKGGASFARSLPKSKLKTLKKGITEITKLMNGYGVLNEKLISIQTPNTNLVPLPQDSFSKKTSMGVKTELVIVEEKHNIPFCKNKSTNKNARSKEKHYKNCELKNQEHEALKIASQMNSTRIKEEREKKDKEAIERLMLQKNKKKQHLKFMEDLNLCFAAENEASLQNKKEEKEENTILPIATMISNGWNAAPSVTNTSSNYNLWSSASFFAFSPLVQYQTTPPQLINNYPSSNPVLSTSSTSNSSSPDLNSMCSDDSDDTDNISCCSSIEHLLDVSDNENVLTFPRLSSMNSIPSEVLLKRAFKNKPEQYKKVLDVFVQNLMHELEWQYLFEIKEKDLKELQLQFGSIVCIRKALEECRNCWEETLQNETRTVKYDPNCDSDFIEKFLVNLSNRN
jgi:hypothetical protein